jgi:hypothetical protein
MILVIPNQVLNLALKQVQGLSNSIYRVRDLDFDHEEIHFHGRTKLQFSPLKRDPMTVKIRAPKMKQVNRMIKILRLSSPIKILLRREPNLVLGFLSI